MYLSNSLASTGDNLAPVPAIPSNNFATGNRNIVGAVGNSRNSRYSRKKIVYGESCISSCHSGLGQDGAKLLSQYFPALVYLQHIGIATPEPIHTKGMQLYVQKRHEYHIYTDETVWAKGWGSQLLVECTALYSSLAIATIPPQRVYIYIMDNDKPLPDTGYISLLSAMWRNLGEANLMVNPASKELRLSEKAMAFCAMWWRECYRPDSLEKF